MRLIKNFLTVLIMVITVSSTLHAGVWFDPTDYKEKAQVSVSALSAFPVGRFSEMYKSGYGAAADISYAPGFRQNYRVALRVGYIKFDPEEETDDGYPTGLEKSYIIPFMLLLDYRLEISSSFGLVPMITGGFSRNSAVYLDRSDTISRGLPTGYPAKKTSRVACEPFTTGGLGLHYSFGNANIIFLRGEWCTIVESSHSMYFAAASLGYEKRF